MTLDKDTRDALKSIDESLKSINLKLSEIYGMMAIEEADAARADGKAFMQERAMRRRKIVTDYIATLEADSAAVSPLEEPVTPPPVPPKNWFVRAIDWLGGE